MNFINESWQYLIVFLAGVFGSSIGISYFFYFFFIKKKHRNSHRTISKISYPKRGEMKMNTQNSQEDQKEVENQKIISELRTQLKKKDQELKKLNDALQSASNNKTGRTVDFEVNNSKESTIKVVFFSVPTEHGTFSLEKGSKNKNDTTWYKVEYKEDETIGGLFYLPGNRDKRALNQMDLFLKPVCEIENSDVKNPQNITLIKPGKVKLEEGKWIIKEKIRLKLS